MDFREALREFEGVVVMMLNMVSTSSSWEGGFEEENGRE